jgi:transcriptional regulator with XRE-family HTH domain
MADRRESPRDVICERLRDTRAALGHTNQADYARRAGISPTAYNNYEHGYRIGLEAALKLCDAYNLSLDWIYFGDTANLPTAVSDKIREYIAAKPKSASSSKKRRPFDAA